MGKALRRVVLGQRCCYERQDLREFQWRGWGREKNLHSDADEEEKRDEFHGG
jgi:hypothetical protein